MAASDHLNPAQHRYDRVAPVADRVYGTNDIHRLFPRTEDPAGYEAMKGYFARKGTPEMAEQFRWKVPDTTTIPWDRASKGPGVPYDQELVRHTLSLPASDLTVGRFDPRHLHGTQPGITHGGVQHYMSGSQGLYADKDNPGNALPFVYVHKDTGVNRLLSGHHRATSALLQGRPLVARYAVGQ